MKTFDSELKKYTDKINLKVSERRELRERILSYMEYHPLPKQESNTVELIDAIPSEAFTLFNFHSRTFRFAGSFLVLAILTVPFVAERAVPGDMLYLVKTNITESVQGQLVASPYEKIEFETRLMERRIAEARFLASEGRLTDEVQSQIAVTVKEHSDAVQNGIAELRTQDAEGAAIAQIAYSSSLDVQSVMLASAEPEATTMDTASTMMMAKVADAPADPILSVVNEARDVIANEQVTTAPSFDGLLARIESETTRAYELFETVKKSATAEEITDIERRLSDVNRLIEEGKQDRVEDETGAANELAGTLKQIQKLVLFMNDIDIRETITLESIVPVVLSDAERLEIANGEYTAIEAVRAEVVEKLPLVTDADVSGKISEGLTMLDGLMITASSSLTIDTVDAVEVTLVEARAMVNDLISMIEFNIQPVPVTDEETTVADDLDVASTTSTTTEEVIVDGVQESDPGKPGNRPE